MIKTLNYQRHGETIEERIDTSGLGFLLIDMQTQYLIRLNPMQIILLLDSQEELIKQCAAYDYPLFVVEYEDASRTNTSLRRHFDDVPRNYLYTKFRDDAFTNPELPKKIDELSLEYLCVMGINASACVKETMESAIRLGKKIITTPQIIANNRYEQKYFKKTLEWIEERGILLANYSDIIDIMH